MDTSPGDKETLDQMICPTCNGTGLVEKTTSKTDDTPGNRNNFLKTSKSEINITRMKNTVPYLRAARGRCLNPNRMSQTKKKPQGRNEKDKQNDKEKRINENEEDNGSGEKSNGLYMEREREEERMTESLGEEYRVNRIREDPPKSPSTPFGSSCSNKDLNDEVKEEEITEGTILTVEGISKTVSKLKSRDWDTLREGIEEAVEIVKSEGICLEGLNRALVASLSSPRQAMVTTGQRAVKDIFTCSDSPIQRPEFDEIVNILLGRMADKNQLIRDDSMEALKTIITHVPVKVVVKVIVHKAPKHKNPWVREAVGFLLLIILKMVGPSSFFPGNFPNRNGPNQTAKEVRKSLLQTAALFLEDQNHGVRLVARKMFEIMIKEPDFDDIFSADVESNLAKKIEKQLILIRYGKTKT